MPSDDTAVIYYDKVMIELMKQNMPFFWLMCTECKGKEEARQYGGHGVFCMKCAREKGLEW